MDRISELKAVSDGTAKAAAGCKAHLAKILDELSFVETDGLVSADTAFGLAAGEGVVSGFGTVGGGKVCVFAQNGSVLEGGMSAKAAEKIARVAENASRSGCPLISIFDTKGTRIDGGIEVLEGYAKIFKAVSALDTLHIAVVKGSNLGVLSALSTIADFCIMYDKAVTAPASPLVIAGGKDASAIGSAKALAAKGVCTHTVKSDEEAAALIYKLTDFFGGGGGCGHDGDGEGDDPNRTSESLRNPLPHREVVKQVFDTDSFFETSASFGTNSVTGFAALGGDNVGIVCAGKKLSPDDLSKIYNQLYLCEKHGLPVVSVVDCEGADFGGDYTDVMKRLAGLFGILPSMTVPRISLITGSAVGAGYTAFASKNIGYGYTLAWADANISVVTGEAQARLEFADVLAHEKDKNKAVEKLAEQLNDTQSSALNAARSGFIDNVIDPALSRPYLISALRMLL